MFKFEIKNLTEFKNLYLHFFICTLKKTGVKLELLTNNDVLMMVEKGFRGGICHAIHRYEKANNKYMKNYDKNIELSYLISLDASNLYGWALYQKLPVNGFK